MVERRIASAPDLHQYPLSIGVPSTELRKPGLFRLKHIEYTLELDDCGKVYRITRRYKNFVWLHDELRKREFACRLPELPSKKLTGNFNVDFVERRRQALEEYLAELIKKPPVIQDDTIWQFLDADMATAVVPRFLCRLPTLAAAAEALKELERIVMRDCNIFRFCCPAVLGELVAFATHESQADASIENAAPPHLKARLSARKSFCSVVQHLLVHERARQGLVDGGMFGALLELLWRVTADCEIAVAAKAQDIDIYHQICSRVTDCLKILLEGSRGVALLKFCQQDDGLGALKRLASEDADTSLHHVAASLIWHGLQNVGVVDALVGSANLSMSNRCGLKILASLLMSADLRARVLASLCIGCVLRQDNTLSEDDRAHCFSALLEPEALPYALDKAEDDAIERAAAATIKDGGSNVNSRQNSKIISAPPASASANPLQGRDSLTSTRRDVKLIELLRSLCSPSELPRLQALVGDINTTREVDDITAVVVAILDHFTRQHERKDELFQALCPIVPQLQYVVDCDSEWANAVQTAGCSSEIAATWTYYRPRMDSSSSTLSSALHLEPADDLRKRAAQVLVRLTWSPGGERSRGGEPPPFLSLHRRARALELANHFSVISQDLALHQLSRAELDCKRQGDYVEQGNLGNELCLKEARLHEFASHINGLQKQRLDLRSEVDISWRTYESCTVSLEQRRLKLGTLSNDVIELRRVLNDQLSEEVGHDEAKQRVRHAEDACHAEISELERLRAAAQAADTYAKDLALRVRDMEARAIALSNREAELEEFLHTAPAQEQRLTSQLAESQRHRAILAENGQRLAADIERGERAAVELKEQERESSSALRSLATVMTELTKLHNTLNSETILTEDEVARLRQLDLDMQPARPSRLSCDSNDRREIESCINFTEAPPTWDDAVVEQEFRSCLHYRSFSKLLRERERLWLAESRWIKAQAKALENHSNKLKEERATHDQQEHGAREQEEQMRQEIAVLQDHVGHAERRETAARDAGHAREMSRAASVEAAEAKGNFELAESDLQQGQTRVRAAEDELAQAREALTIESGRSLRARVGTETRILELEVKMRTFIEEWSSVKLEERRIAILKVAVMESLQSEARERKTLRQELQKLIQELHELDCELADADRVDELRKADERAENEPADYNGAPFFSG